MGIASFPSPKRAAKIVKACRRFGWSIVQSSSIKDDGTTVWTCIVTPGPRDPHIFTSTESQRQARVLAYEGLTDRLRYESTKPEVSDYQTLFPESVPFYDSRSNKGWEALWRDKPKVVGIDTEGNHQTPPIFVEIATSDYCIVEVPHFNVLSPNLQRLLDDTSIVKVFCDKAGRDQKCLGLSKRSDGVVDLEDLMVPVFGPFTNGRGLSRILPLCMPELNVFIRKPPRKKVVVNVKGARPLVFKDICQPKSPPSIYGAPSQEVLHGPLDAWCILQAYQRLLEL